MKTIKTLLVSTVILTLISCNNSGIAQKSLNTEIDTVSYSLGLDFGIKVKANFSEIDRDLYMQGFISGLDSTDILVEQKDVNEILRNFFQKQQQEAQKKQQEEALKKAEEEFGAVKEEGIKFLAENKSKEGVISTESGLQYIILEEGTGERPVATSKVKVHYHGTLIDGTVFDSSIDKGTPIEFMANRVIKGWTEGLQLMAVGSKYKFFIPQELAYGASPRQGGKIRPFDALIFEVELLEIVK
jgi:FKBP-type peptidyl-prolyl cis-trans isomerase